MLDHPIHAINQRETMVSQATDVLKHEHDAILMALKILDQISGEARQGNATSADVVQFLGFLREFVDRSEEHTSELQSLMHISYAVFCLKKKKLNNLHINCVDLISTQTKRKQPASNYS